VRGVDRACGDIAALADTVGFALPAHEKRQFAIENDVSGLGCVGVVCITRVGAVLPDIRVRKALGTKLLREFYFIVRAFTPWERTDAPRLA
jgi:hypothetical protein